MTLVLAPRLFEVHQHQTTSDDYYTPAWVFERMGIAFDLDVCSPPGGIPWIPARRFFTMADDGLAQPWEGRVWMNPPWSQTAPWAEQFVAHRNGVALLPFSRAYWFLRVWEEADALVAPASTLFEFVYDGPATHNGRQPKANYMPVHFAAFGEECVDAISRLGRVRR